MGTGILSAAYIAASILFILSLGGLSNQEKAKRAVWYGIFGMLIAVTAIIIFGPGFTTLSYVLLVPLLAIGALIGKTVAQRVEMTEMPQLVAALHSFVGLAAVFIGLNAALQISGMDGQHYKLTNVELFIHKIEIFLGVFIGAITFTGSILAYAKLAGKIDGKALILPGRHILNSLAVFFSLMLLITYINSSELWTLYLMLLIAFILGAHLVAAIGGADMPVVVSMLNSYSGWAAAGIGFTLNNSVLIIAGACVGSSGAILSYIMCKAMNRSIISVMLGGFGGEQSTLQTDDKERNVKSGSADDVSFLMSNADSIIIIPGYGLAVARAQHVLQELTEKLIAKGISVKYAIHPVAGRMPGHMNVLLAEADVPYEQVVEMEDINSEFSQTDLVLVIGANDVVNPAAKTPGSAIYGMPILEADKAKMIIVNKRSMSPGYAGLDNELFYSDKTMMLFGDAKKVVEDLVKQI